MINDNPNLLQNHSGSKYIRRIWATGIRLTESVGFVDVDFYDIVNGLGVHNPAVQHALKKLMYSGQRNKASVVQDLREARDAISRAIEMTEALECPCTTTTEESPLDYDAPTPR